MYPPSNQVGSSAPRYCNQCGAQNQPMANFCNRCGSRLQHSVPPPAPGQARPPQQYAAAPQQHWQVSVPQPPQMVARPQAPSTVYPQQYPTPTQTPPVQPAPVYPYPPAGVYAPAPMYAAPVAYVPVAQLPQYHVPTPGWRIAFGWLSLVLGLGLSALGASGSAGVIAAGLVFQLLWLVLAINLSLHSNRTTKINGKILLWIWGILFMIGFVIGFMSVVL